MPYIKIASNNYSIGYSIDLPDNSDNWYEVSEPGNYKLINGKIESCELEEHTNAFTLGRINNPFVVELKNYVSQFLSDTDWLISRHLEQREINKTSLTESEYGDLISYRQYLRSLTNNPPENIQEFVFEEFNLKDRYSYFSYQNICSLLSSD